MREYKTIKDFNLKGKKLFLRVDFNVPIKNGNIGDDTRIRAALPTIEYAISQGARVILASHLGRPKGERVTKYSLEPVAKYISEKFLKAYFVDDCIGEKVENAVDTLKNGEVLLLENLRFYPGETNNSPEFVSSLKRITEIYINDAFGTCHRKHASVYGLPNLSPSKGLGFLVEKEVMYIEKLLKDPERPFAAILGGAKVSDKIGVIKSMMNIVDKLFIGGAMAYTFLRYKGNKIGTSPVEEDLVEVVGEIYDIGKDNNVTIFTPFDHVVAVNIDGDPIYTDKVDIDDGMSGFDIGRKTVKYYLDNLEDCKTVLWNGPMGVFEKKQFSDGTFLMAENLAKLDATVVVGGGDSVSAIKKAGVDKKISHLSTGGGASLEFIEKKSLSGLEILKK